MTPDAGGPTDGVGPGTATAFRALLDRPPAELPDPLPMRPLPHVPGRASVRTPFLAEVRPPGSKSLTNRALLLAGLASGRSVLRGALTDADDARRMLGALRALGVVVVELPTETGVTVEIEGVGGAPSGGCSLDLNNAGTATRFLTAAACLADAPVVVDGNARMRQRPIGELVAMLRTLGVTIDELGEPGSVPLRVHPGRPSLAAGEPVHVARTLSSQYISALLLIAPWSAGGIELCFTRPPTSEPYVRMTLNLLRRCGVSGVRDEGQPLRSVRVDEGAVDGFDLDIEPDASGATYFWGAAAIVPGATCRVPGLSDVSLQGDTAFVHALAAMGAVVHSGYDAITVGGSGSLRGIDADCSGMPDAAMTLAAVACFAEGPTLLRGLATLRVKETDRIAALSAELAKVGVGTEVVAAEGDESLRIVPPAGGIDEGRYAARVTFETYDDHRMAMALSLIALRRPNVRIADPGCVAKTYAGFWRDYASMFAGG